MAQSYRINEQPCDLRGPRFIAVCMFKKSKAARSGQEDLRSCGFRSARSVENYFCIIDGRGAITKSCS